MTKFLSRREERSFWDWTGKYFPSLWGAPSTKYYFECEKSLFVDYCPDLEGKKILKTDLWDEAKNTHILHWTAQQGAQVYGIDISGPIVKEAAKIFNKGTAARFIINDVRQIAFASDSFDVIYSMGTIEHFREYRQALKECFRVLRPGGLIFLGVPNRWDPFLRPIMVGLMQALNLYSYGYERSFSRKQLEGMLIETGFEIRGLSGVLFIPGILRMIDLFFHVRAPAWTRITAPMIYPFSLLFRKFPFLRPHSYLICSVAHKPGVAS